MSVYDKKAVSMEAKEISFDQYRGKVLLIVNIASKCGFTPQLEGLESLNKTFAAEDLEILGFPCNQFNEEAPGTNEELKDFCQLNYGVTFQLFEKLEVRGENAHPLFAELSQKAPFKGWDLTDPVQEKFHKITQEKYPDYLQGDSIKWNFTKFLVNKEGEVVKRFEPWDTPETITDSIRDLLS